MAYVYIYIYVELIRIFKTALKRFVPVFVLPDALDRFPHEGTWCKLPEGLKEDVIF
jgi:hypothetical protein